MILPIKETLVNSGISPTHPGPSSAALAAKAITSKATSLGSEFTGPIASAVTPYDAPGVVGGFQQAFTQCIIFFSPATGAHEVHGDILKKYVVLPLKGINLGLPVTDETGTPDGVGRYNHFANDGSIYWHPNTGPMAVQGAVRDNWASQGWERGPLGYPVRDVFVPESGETAGDFQNGVIWIGADGYTPAAVATLSQPQLLNLIWQQFDSIIHQSPDNVGLHPEKSFDGVTDTGYGFPQSRNRGFKMTLNGFHDNGLVLPDINFQVQMAVVISLGTTLAKNDSGQTVEVYSIGAAIDDLTVTDSGLLTTVTDSVAQKVQAGIQSASDAGISVGSTFSHDVPLLSLKTMQDGSLNFFISPTTAGKVAQAVIQTQLTAM